jgi:hypothetical protein
MYYSFSEQEAGILSNSIQRGLPIMKVAIRAFAVCIVLAGAAAASLSPASTRLVASSQAGPEDGLPIPLCGPGICPPHVQPALSLR